MPPVRAFAFARSNAQHAFSSRSYYVHGSWCACAVTALFSFVYMLAALPVGVVTDRVVDGPHPESRIKLVVLFGWFGLTVGYLLLGPLAYMSPIGTLLGAMVVQGVATAGIVIPSLPELQVCRSLERTHRQTAALPPSENAAARRHLPSETTLSSICTPWGCRPLLTVDHWWCSLASPTQMTPPRRCSVRSGTGCIRSVLLSVPSSRPSSSVLVASFSRSHRCLPSQQVLLQSSLPSSSHQPLGHGAAHTAPG